MFRTMNLKSKSKKGKVMANRRNNLIIKNKQNENDMISDEVRKKIHGEISEILTKYTGKQNWYMVSFIDLGPNPLGVNSVSNMDDDQIILLLDLLKEVVAEKKKGEIKTINLDTVH